MARFIRTVPLAIAMALAIATSANAATYQVDNNQDEYESECTSAADDCSLRGALENANSSAEDDSIVLPAGIYRFSEYGDLDIGPTDDENGKLTIDGAGAEDTIIDADGEDRAIDIEDSTVVISGVAIRNGRADMDEYRQLATIEAEATGPC